MSGKGAEGTPGGGSAPGEVAPTAEGAGGARRRILVTGASGFIGRHVLAALVRRGDEPVGLVREPAASGLAGGPVRVVAGDLTDPEAVGRAMRGAQAVVHLAAATRASAVEAARRVNVEGTRTLLAAACAAGVRRIVVLSTISVHRRKVGAYGATKREMERLVLESGIPAVILRPSLVYGPGSAGLFQRMTRLVEALPVVPVIGRGDQPLRPVHVDDVVEAILRCLDAPEVVGRCYDLLGPDDVGMDGLLRGIERTLGLRRRHLHVPVPVALAAARAMTAVMRDPPVSVDNVIGADQPTPFDPRPARRDLRLREIPLAEGLPHILDPGPEPGVDAARPLRVAILGLGKMGVAHTALLHTLPGVRVAAVVDVRRGAGSALRGMGFRVPCFTSTEAALDAARPHGVIVATPPHTHADLVRLAAERGAGVLVEKPLAHTFAAARAVAGALAAAGVTASCGYVLAYLPSFERARKLLEEGAIGEARTFEASMFISQVFGRGRGWIYDPARSGGGVLPNVASHLLFLLHWYFGPVEEMAATTERLHNEVEDAARLRLRFAGGLEGEVTTSWSVPGYPLSVTTISVQGTRGTLRVDNEGLLLRLEAAAAGLPAGITRLRAADLPQAASFDLGGEGYWREDADFVRALRGGPPVPTSIERALHVQAVLDAAYRSARRGGTWLAPPPGARARAIAVGR